MRRGVGVSAVVAKKKEEEKYKEKKSNIDDDSIDKLQVQLGRFQDKLEWFAAKHQTTLQTDPLFRREFIEMCATIGVDPLASSKGFWTEFLGVGTFYYQLAVQAIEMVLAGAEYHGGIVRLADLFKRLVESRSSYLEGTQLSCEDVIQAFEILEVIGKSCGVIKTEDRIENALVFCVPEELSLDNTMAMQYVAQSGKAYYTISTLVDELGWSTLRVKSVTEKLLREGIVWKDSPYVEKDDEDTSLYWFPGLFVEIDVE